MIGLIFRLTIFSIGTTLIAVNPLFSFWMWLGFGILSLAVLLFLNAEYQRKAEIGSLLGLLGENLSDLLEAVVE